MSPAAVLGWWEDGGHFFAGSVDRLAAPDLDRPSLLPGWPRRTVVAHVARNPDASGVCPFRRRSAALAA